MFQKSKIIKLLILLIFFISPAKAEFDIKARTVILQDYLSGEILYEKKADLSIFPASITKNLSSKLISSFFIKSKAIIVVIILVIEAGKIIRSASFSYKISPDK